MTIRDFSTTGNEGGYMAEGFLIHFQSISWDEFTYFLEPGFDRIYSDLQLPKVGPFLVTLREYNNLNTVISKSDLSQIENLLGGNPKMAIGVELRWSAVGSYYEELVVLLNGVINNPRGGITRTSYFKRVIT